MSARGAGRRGGRPKQPCSPFLLCVAQAFPDPGAYLPRPSPALASPRTPGHGLRAAGALTAAAKVVSPVQPKEAVPACRTGLAAHVRLARALAVALRPRGKVRPGGGGGVWMCCPTAPRQLSPQTHRLALGKSAQRAPGIAAAAWRRVEQAWTLWGWPSPPCTVPLPQSCPSTPMPPPTRLTGAALRVAGTQPPEPGFTVIAAGPLHVGSACTGGLCLGEGETEGQDGSLPFYPKPSALEP